MASLPARQQSQRRISPPEQSSNIQSQQPQSSPSPVRTRSEDSQTLFLNKPDSPQEQATSDPPLQQASSDAADDASVKKCWICFSDSTEDTLETSPWRSPCPCALVAHEECLLDWIADMELPTNRRNKNDSIQCPQCKGEIKLSRPRNLVVDAVRKLEKWSVESLYPGAGTVLFAIAYNASTAWGVQSIYAIFGTEDGFRILRPMILNNVRPPIEFGGSARDFRNNLLGLAVDHLVHWRLYVGLPLITPILILSRTTLADSVLPVLPILFFATQTPTGNQPLDFGTWPPSAGLAFSILPYLRSAYMAYWRRVWAPKEKQWLKEIQPRARDHPTTDEHGNPDPIPDNINPDEEPLIEVRLDVEDWDSGSDEDDDDIVEGLEEAMDEAWAEREGGDALNDDQAPQLVEAGEEDAQPNDNQQPAEQPAVPVQPAAAAGGAGAGAGRNDPRLAISVTPIAETVLGALLFPAIAGISGELLKVVLPRAWTSAPGLSSRGTRIAARGLLQEKWGRSLVGGCLFVVLKDAVMLYVRWKMAQMHRKRKVLDWEGRKNGAGVTS